MADPLDWLQQLLGGAPQAAPGMMAMLRRAGAGADYMDDPGGTPTTPPRGDNRDQHWLAPGQSPGLSSAAGPFAGRGTFLHPNELGIYGWPGRTTPPGDEVIRPGDHRAFAAPYMPNASGDEYQRRLSQQTIPSWRSFPEANGGVRISYPGAAPPVEPPARQPQTVDVGTPQADALGLLLQRLGRGGGGLNLTPPAYPWESDERENFRPSYRGDEPPSRPPVDLLEFLRSPLTQSVKQGRGGEFSAPPVGAPISPPAAQPEELQQAPSQILGGEPSVSGGYSMGRRFGQTSEPLNLSAGFNLPGLGLSIGSSLRPGRGLTAPEFRAYHRIPF